MIMKPEAVTRQKRQNFLADLDHDFEKLAGEDQFISASDVRNFNKDSLKKTLSDLALFDAIANLSNDECSQRNQFHVQISTC